MPSERIQRRIERFLEQAEEALDAQNWRSAEASISAVLAIDETNADALAFRAMVEAAQATSGVAATQSGHDDPGNVVVSTAAAVPPSPPTAFVDGRYQVRRFLGEGGKKRVFLAHDTKLDRDVAFALIKTEGLDATGRERIVREAQAMGRLGAHPHVVTIFEIGEEGDAPYIVQELMGGGDVEKLLAQAEGALPLPRTLEIAKDVCDGLVFAHAQGIVHRDLKPGNVWLTAGGVAKIGDFGLAVSLDRTRLTQHGMMVGTVAYMPPEQALGGEVTPQSDLYAFGAMLYEMVTGKPPFRADDPTAVISQHINTPPVAPSWNSQHCPPDLERLILQLLAKVPADRPRSASEVLTVLDRVDPAASSASHSDSQANPLDRLARGVFVGRERELERLRSAFDEAFAGRGSVVMLVGEPGIGKTRTTQELETYARMRGAKVFWGRAHEASGEPPYWPWMQVGRAYRDQTPEETRRRECQPYAVELQRILPGLRDLFPGLPEPPPADSEEAQFALFDAWSSFIRSVAAETPLVIVLDDAHWFDRPSLRLLTHLSHDIDRARLLVLGTYRDTDLDRTQPLSEALAEMNREQLFSRILLRGLSEEETSTYIRAAANAQPSAELVRRIHVETEGNPFFVAEVVNLMAEEGTLASHSLADVRIPQGVREALGRRLDRLSPEANEVLSIAAVIGREFSHALLAALSSASDDALLQLVEEALKARVIEETNVAGEYRFTHALMQEALYAELSTARRVLMHGRIAEALEARYGEDASEFAAELARHYVESAVMNPRHAAPAARYSKLAAEQAQTVAAWDEAVRHYRACLSAIENDRGAFGIDEITVRSELARSERFAGDIDTAWVDVQRAMELAERRDESRQFARAAVYALDFPWRSDEDQLALAERALQQLGDADPYLRSWLLFRRAYSLSGIGRSEAAAATDEAAEFATERGYHDVAARVAFLQVVRGSGSDPATAAVLWRDWLAAHSTDADFHAIAGAKRSLALVLLWSGQLAEAEAAAGDSLAYARSIRYADEEEWSLRTRIEIAILRAQRSRIEALLADTERLPSRTVSSALSASYYYSVTGDLSRAARELDVGAWSQAAQGWIRSRLLLELARLRLLDGDEPAARALIETWDESWDRAETALGAWAGTAALAELTAVQPDAALLKSAYDWLAGASALRTFGVRSADAVRGYLALALDLIGEAEQHFLAGLAWCEREQCPVEAGRNHQGLVEVASRRGDHALAMQHLDSAGELFGKHGATLYLDQVLAKKQFLKA